MAGALTRLGAEVVVIAREPTATQIAESGIEVRSRALDADFTAHPRVVTELSTPVDHLLVATKAGGLEAGA